MRLALDHHFSPLIAVGLRDRGHDARAVAELGWQAEADDALLALCATQRRALLTNNVVDFVVISRTTDSWTPCTGCDGGCPILIGRLLELRPHLDLPARPTWFYIRRAAGSASSAVAQCCPAVIVQPMLCAASTRGSIWSSANPIRRVSRVAMADTVC